MKIARIALLLAGAFVIAACQPSGETQARLEAENVRSSVEGDILVYKSPT